MKEQLLSSLGADYNSKHGKNGKKERKGQKQTNKHNQKQTNIFESYYSEDEVQERGSNKQSTASFPDVESERTVTEPSSGENFKFGESSKVASVKGKKQRAAKAQKKNQGSQPTRQVIGKRAHSEMLEVEDLIEQTLGPVKKRQKLLKEKDNQEAAGPVTRSMSAKKQAAAKRPSNSPQKKAAKVAPQSQNCEMTKIIQVLEEAKDCQQGAILMARQQIDAQEKHLFQYTDNYERIKIIIKQIESGQRAEQAQNLKVAAKMAPVAIKKKAQKLKKVVQTIPEELYQTDGERKSNFDSIVVEIDDSSDELIPVGEQSIEPLVNEVMQQSRAPGKNDPRAQILKKVRETKRGRGEGGKFSHFSDSQLLFMTDPKVLCKLVGLTQPQLASHFLKHPKFANFKGSLSQPILSRILKAFEVNYNGIKK